MMILSDVKLSIYTKNHLQILSFLNTKMKGKSMSIKSIRKYDEVLFQELK